MPSDDTEPPVSAERTNRSDVELTGPRTYAWPWVRQEIVLLAREPVAVFFSLAFPLIIYGFIGMAYADEEVMEGVVLIDIMFPALIGTVAANLAIMGMPVYFAEIRSRGVLKRYRAMPVPGWLFGAAVFGSLMVLLVVSTVVLALIVGTTHGFQEGILSLRFWGLMALLVLWLSGLGFFLGSIPAKVRTAQTVGAVLFFALLFSSGVAAPLDGLPTWLEKLTMLNPLRHWFEGLMDAYVGVETPLRRWLYMLAALPVAAALVPFGLRNLRREDG